MDRHNARVHLICIDDEPHAVPRLITSESGVYRVGDRVIVEAAPNQWRAGRVNDRPAIGAGGVIMVTINPHS